MSTLNNCCQKWIEDCSKHIARSTDLERQVAALTKGRDLAVKQVGDVARQLGLCQIQRDELTEQVAALTKERDEYKSAAMTTLVEMGTQLAASQAREQKLRDALEVIRKASSLGSSILARDILGFASEALALPTDDSALQARLKEEREKCAVECEQHGPTIGRIFASKIRSMK